MHKLLLAALLAFGCQAADAIDLNDGGIPWRTFQHGEPVKHPRPMLVYFGAVWCPPCKALETEVFNQPSVQTALRAFDPVFVDGDAGDTDVWMERFKVIGFPSVLVIAPDGSEAGRFVGAADKDGFIRFLAASTDSKQPDAMMERLESGKPLTVAQWHTLSDIAVMDAGWLQYDDETGAAQLKRRRDRLARAVAMLSAVEPVLPISIENTLRFKLLVLDVLSNTPANNLLEPRALVERIFSDSTSLAALTDLLVNYSQDTLAYLYPDDTPAKRALARRFVALLDAEAARFAGNPPAQLQMMLGELALLRWGSDDIDADKEKLAKGTHDLLKATTSPPDRLAIAAIAAFMLESTGDEFAAEAALRESIAIAPDAFFLKDSLASYARRRGDVVQAAEYSEAAFRGSPKNPAVMRWGVSWVKALIARDSNASATIERGADEVLQLATASGTAFRGFNAYSMTSMATSLGRWASAPKRDAEAKTRLLTAFGKLCDSVKEDTKQAQACATSLAALKNPPPKEDHDSDA